MTEPGHVEMTTLPLSGEKRVEINLGLTTYSMTIPQAYDLAANIIDVLRGVEPAVMTALNSNGKVH